MPPVNRYLLGNAYQLPRITRVTAGIDQQLGTTRVAVTYSYQRGSRLSRGLNLNPPLDGARPDPTFANIVAVASDARSRQHDLNVNASINPGALLPAFNGR